MSTPATPSNPTPAGDDRNLVAVDPATAVTFEDKIQLFWKNNRMAVVGVCVLVLLAIVAREGWQYMAQKKDREVENAYAAATTPEQLKAFAAANPSHALGAIAQLRLADDAYKAGKSAEAITGYEKVITALKEGPLVARAQVGRAMANVQAGKTAEAGSELAKLADDATQLKAVRAEAAYHLTSLAVEAGNATDAQKRVDQLMQIDPTSTWTQRAMALRATLPAEKPAAPVPGATTPVAPQKKDDAAPAVQVKIPGAK